MHIRQGRLSPSLWQALQEIKSVVLYSQRQPIFQRGADPDGIYIVESGRVRVLLTPETRTQLLSVEDMPGTMFGLSETISGKTYRVTVEAECFTTMAFISREKFLAVLQHRADFMKEVIRLLAEDLDSLHRKFREVNAPPGRRPHHPRGRPAGQA